MKPRPLCRYCGKPIAKRTHGVHFGKSQGDPSASQFWTNRPERPTSKADAQRLVNEQIVSVRWSRGEEYGAKQAGFDYISYVSTWDGESYEDPYFCNGDHAKQFAYACAAIKDRPLAMDAYWKALKRQQESSDGS